MGWLRNRRTTTKLMLMVGLLAVVVGVVGYQGVGGLRTLEQQGGEVERHALGMSDLKNAKADMLRISRAVRNAIIDAVVAEMKSVDARAEEIKRAEARFREAFAAFQKSLVSAETKAQAAAVARDFEEVRKLQNKVVDFAKGGSISEARDVMLKANEVTVRMEGAIETLAKRKETQMKAAVETGDRVYRSTLAFMVGGSVVGVAVAWILGLFFARLIARPLARASEVFGRVAEGDLTQRLDVETTDEVGQMARAFDGFMERLHEVMVQVQRAAEGAAGAAQQLSAAAEQLSAGSQEQASSLEETAASLEEMTGTVRQNAENAAPANQLATGSRGTAEKGGQVVSQAVRSMGEINAASTKIVAIITTIDEIAFQTNLLALNAAVEAARAGEQGRGFAVVASEVRNLAQRAALAAKEIKGLIQDSVGRVEAGSALVNQSGATLDEIVGAVKKVTDVIAEIAAASREQSQGIDQVNRAVAQMDQVVQSNAAQTEQLSSTSQTMSAQAQQLQELVRWFRLDAASVRMVAPAPAVTRPGRPAGSAAPATRHRAAAAPEPSGRSAQVSAMPAAGALVPRPTNGSAHAKDDGFEEF